MSRARTLTRTHTHTRTHTRTRTHDTRVRTYAHTYAHANKRAHAYTRAYTHAYTHARTHTHTEHIEKTLIYCFLIYDPYIVYSLICILAIWTLQVLRLFTYVEISNMLEHQ